MLCTQFDCVERYRVYAIVSEGWQVLSCVPTLTPQRVSSLLYVIIQVDNSVETCEFLDNVKERVFRQFGACVPCFFSFEKRLGDITLFFLSFSTCSNFRECDVVMGGTHGVRLMTKLSMCMSPQFGRV